MLNTDGVITAICVTLMYTADSRSRQQITLLRKARSTRHNAVKHDSQLVTRFYDVTSWPCDELTGSATLTTLTMSTTLALKTDWNSLSIYGCKCWTLQCLHLFTHMHMCGLMMHRPIGAHSQTTGDGRRFRVTACDLSKVANCNFSTSVLSVLGLLVVTDRCVMFNVQS